MKKLQQTTGWLDNMNDSKVSLPSDFIGEGYSNIGRNYSPAWGGQFQNGGGMPGSVGFTYARTGAPSNGPYAKKTMPSAQDGIMTPRQKRGIELQLKDYAREQKEKEELVKTGTIRNPRSIKYNVPRKEQPTLKQDTRTKEEIVKSAEAMRNVQEGNLYGERPLLYLSDPTKILGDVGVPGYEGTEADRQRIMMNRYNPNLHPSERFQRQLDRGLEQVPAAAFNVGLATMGLAEGNLAPSVGRVLGESLNPIPLPFNVGMKDTSTFWRNLKNYSDAEGLIDENKIVQTLIEDPIFRGKYPTNTKLLDYRNINTEIPKYNPFSNQIMNVIPSTIEDTSLSKEMEPYISRYISPISREEEVFRNSLGRDYYNRKLLEDTVHLDREGNVIPTPSMQRGGVVRDNRGYWNPDNWGKPVEIDGNDITMRGVNQPLLGISDTGDMKLMKPGKDYKFKGKRVTELPISKDGSQLVKLDQLTNFTNYNRPQPGGWLDNL